MSETRGGINKRKGFRWEYDPNERILLITNEDGKRHEYTIKEIQNILARLETNFGGGFFPLANNVEKLANGSERLGLGSVILEQKPGDIYHAQGSSYLGVVMEECHYFEWNGKHKGIHWRLVDTNFNRESVISKLLIASREE